MKLLYATRVCIPSSAAQAVQISAMAVTFNKFFQSDFCLLSATNGSDMPLLVNNWIKLQKGKYELYRYLRVFVRTIIYCFSEPEVKVYTRDIGLCLAAIIVRRPVIFEAHKNPNNFMAKFLFAKLCRHKLFGLVTISNALAQYYSEKFSIEKESILVAHDGVFAWMYDSVLGISRQTLLDELGLPQDKTIVVHTGSLYEGRGAELFEIVARYSKSIFFVQVGGDSNDISYWKKYYSNKKIENILFVERQPQDVVRRYQVAADLLFYMITRRTETFWCCSPLKLFEYMASGSVILASRIGSIGEVVSCDNAICFDPDFPDTLTAALDKYFIDVTTIKKLGAVARSDVLKNYTWELRAAKILNHALFK